MPSKEILVREDAYLAQDPDFQLVGRDKELQSLSRILMRSQANSVILTGPGGAGASAICRGLAQAKDDPNAPFDVINKRIFWLDTDQLFSSGSNQQIQDQFTKILGQLKRGKESVLIIDDAKDFIEACRNSGNTHFINALVRANRDTNTQLILEARVEDLGLVLAAHSDMSEFFTVLDIGEPDEENLASIVQAVAKKLELHHKFPASQAALESAIRLTTKYPVSDHSLSRAQPEATINLLDRAYTYKRQQAHENPPAILTKDRQLKAIRRALGDPQSHNADLTGKTPEELKAMADVLEVEIEQDRAQWDETRAQMTALYKKMRRADEFIRKMEDELIEKQREMEQSAQASNEDAAQLSEEDPASVEFTGLGQSWRNAGFNDTPETADLREKIEMAQAEYDKYADEYGAMVAQANEGLVLEPADVDRVFSEIANIPVEKLNEDEREKLMRLDDDLKARVFGQDHAIDQLVGSIKVSSVGLKDPEKPQAVFMFPGPSGVGKTETAKALAELRHGSRKSLFRVDMGEYMEQNSVNKLIGAPPGYEGFEVGGALTTAIKKNPRQVVLFDEIEKAHPKVFDVMLQMIDDGRLTDSRGFTASFSEAEIIFTTNVGAEHFLDPDLTYEQAQARMMEDLKEKFRPEFLNRFGGRQDIVGFKALGLPVIEKIVEREFRNLNQQIAETGRDIHVEASPETIKAMCRTVYDPETGARGVPGFIKNTVKRALSDAMLTSQSASGLATVTYDEQTGQVHISDIVPQHIQEQQPAAAEDKSLVTATNG